MTDLLLDACATYRLTRLVTTDTITQPARDRIIRWTYRHTPAVHNHPDDNPAIAAIGTILDSQPAGAWQTFTEDDPHAPKLATLITCRWCAGIWIAFLVSMLRLFTPRHWRRAAWALTCASAAAWLARLEDD